MVLKAQDFHQDPTTLAGPVLWHLPSSTGPLKTLFSSVPPSGSLRSLRSALKDWTKARGVFYADFLDSLSLFSF